MLLKLKKLNIKNFLSFKDVELNLDKNGYILVSGVNENPDDCAKSNGSGKCFGKGTQILMWDGTTKAVEDIKVNDIVMGWDSTPRIVLETHSGIGQLYEVSSGRNQYKYICNGEHILCLHKTLTRCPSTYPEFLEISVNDWLKSTDSLKRSYCQYIKPVEKFYTNPLSNLRLDPYFLGLWLGDGTSVEPTVCSADIEIKDFLYTYSNTMPAIHLVELKKENSPCIAYRFSISQYGSGSAKNPVLENLKYYNLINNKHIPLEYLTASKEDRLRLLAGLIDTDGCLVTSKKAIKNNLKYNYHYSYEFVQKDTILVDHIIALARSLGFKVTKYVKNTLIDKITNRRKDYIRIVITGNLVEIPVKINRKKCPQVFNLDKAICYSLHPTITPIGMGEFYGFQISGDGKFLLDNYLVVHNSSIFEAIAWVLTGETIRGTKDVKRFNSTKKEKCEVTIEFLVDGIEYKIIRTKDPSNLFVFINGEDKSSKGIRDSQHILEEYLPDITAQLIGSVIILGQGLPMRFSNNSPSGRKDVLEKLSKSDFMIEDLKNKVISRKSILDNHKRQIEDKILTLNTLINSNTSIIEKNTIELNALKDVNYIDIIESNKKLLDQYNIQVSDLTSNKNDIQLELDSILSSQNATTKEKYDEKTKLNENFDPKIKEKNNLYTESKSKEAVYQSKISSINSIKTHCPTCGQPLKGVEKPDPSKLIEELENQKNITSNITNEINKLNQDKKIELDKIDKKYYSLELSYSSKIQDCRSNITNINSKLNSINNEANNISKIITNTELQQKNHDYKISQINKSIDEAKESINNSKFELDKLKIDLDNDKIHLEVISKFESALKRDFRGILLNNIISYINTKAKEYSNIVFGTDKLDFILDGNNISITYCNKDYANLSGGEKQRVDLIIQFALRDMLCKYLNFSCNILVLDEIIDNLDSIGCQKVMELISMKLNDVDSIYIISHHADIPMPADYEIVVNKDKDGISYVRNN